MRIRNKTIEAPPPFKGGFLRSVSLKRDRVPSFEAYPYNIPAVKNLGLLRLHPRVTFFVGENGSGKSTLIEAMAAAIGYNPEGGSRNLLFSTRRTESPLHEALSIERGVQREGDGFFLRAESFYNVATAVDDLDVARSHGGISLHAQSHGESFLSLISGRFHGGGLYLLDEPEAALSPNRQLTTLSVFHDLVSRRESQLLIATHSPILLTYPDATIYQLDETGIGEIAYEDADVFKTTRDFLANREAYLRHLCGDSAQ